MMTDGMRFLRLSAFLLLAFAAFASPLAFLMATDGLLAAEAGACSGDGDCNDCRSCDSCPPGCRAPVAALPSLVPGPLSSALVAVLAAEHEAVAAKSAPADIFHPPRFA